ncbi:MAG: hypothetical protein AAB479_00990 [Patescibacteria group bacterium]
MAGVGVGDTGGGPASGWGVRIEDGMGVREGVGVISVEIRGITAGLGDIVGDTMVTLGDIVGDNKFVTKELGDKIGVTKVVTKEFSFSGVEVPTASGNEPAKNEGLSSKRKSVTRESVIMAIPQLMTWLWVNWSMWLSYPQAENP